MKFPFWLPESIERNTWILVLDGLYLYIDGTTDSEGMETLTQRIENLEKRVADIQAYTERLGQRVNKLEEAKGA